MTKEDLLKEILKVLTKSKASKLAGLAETNHGFFEVLLELTFYPKKEVAFRAAWILENAFLKSPGTFRSCLNAFIEAYTRQKNLSCQRHFTKIMMQITSPENLATVAEVDFEGVVETTFSWLIDAKTPVAVQVNCLDILYNLSFRHAWIRDELREQTEFFLKGGSAAMQSRGKRILEKLN